MDIAVAIEDAIDAYLADDPKTCAEVAKEYSRLSLFEWPNAAAEVGHWKHAGSYFDNPTGGNYDLWQSPTDEHTQIQVGVANGKEYVCARHTKRRISRPLPGMPDEIAKAYA
ncbi:MAG: hypothetical protein NC311_15390 [Muribaculaceae bacterium]|nr:hypothetical protein [Muribaculaceae bacterium]